MKDSDINHKVLEASYIPSGLFSSLYLYSYLNASITDIYPTTLENMKREQSTTLATIHACEAQRVCRARWPIEFRSSGTSCSSDTTRARRKKGQARRSKLKCWHVWRGICDIFGEVNKRGLKFFGYKQDNLLSIPFICSNVYWVFRNAGGTAGTAGTKPSALRKPPSTP